MRDTKLFYRSLAIASVVSCALLQPVTGPANAYQSSCLAAHCYSLASYFSTGIYSAHLLENREPLWATNVAQIGAHLNSEMWLTMQDGSYIEAGLRYGDDSFSDGQPCANVCYDLFWSETKPDGSSHRTIITNTTPNGYRDEWAIGRYGGAWIIKLNGNLVGTSSYATDPTSQRLDVGSELAQDTCSSLQSNGYNTNMHVLVQASGGTLHDPAWTNPVVNSCSSTLMLGGFVSPTQFAWNKPKP
jgi:hypothetical protein